MNNTLDELKWAFDDGRIGYGDYCTISKGLNSLFAKIAELEAENDELKKANRRLESFNVQANILFDAYKDPCREKIAALVKPLGWDFNTDYEIAKKPNGYDVVYFGGPLPFFVDSKETPEAAKQAAEAHHREKVLSLLNLPA